MQVSLTTGPRCHVNKESAIASSGLLFPPFDSFIFLEELVEALELQVPKVRDPCFRCGRFPFKCFDNVPNGHAVIKFKPSGNQPQR